MSAGDDRIHFLGLGFDPFDEDELLATLDGRDAAQPFAYWVTPNVDHVVRLHEDKSPDRDEIWQAYYAAKWCSCDSRILAALARRRGVIMPVVPGSDMTPTILDKACRPGDRIAVVGGKRGTLAALAAKFPHLDIVQHEPPMGMRRNPAAMEAAADFVAAARARFTFLAVGSPQQELLAQRILRRGDSTGIGLCIGAAIEFVVGEMTRAPEIVQRLHLEWAFRLLSDPARLWKRYLITGPRIFGLVRKEEWRDPPGA